MLSPAFIHVIVWVEVARTRCRKQCMLFWKA